ncbi:MAG: YbaL family putative K(+) efflux transporter [Caulobacter sp.]|nr:YbaL family putative K(+) efflux transporter [Caulobacter sp.]
MPHHTPLIATIVAGLVVAFALGAAAQRMKISPLVGYLLAGVLVGPFTPGFVADADLAQELAEIGVILLMFGVGLHFSLKDLLAVRRIAIPGALGQMAVATLLGMGLAHFLGWTLIAGIVFGLALSVASTVVLLRALQERRLVQTDKGRIAVGWLIVEDVAMVLALVLLPALAGSLGDAAADASPAVWLGPLGITLLKVAAFVAFMLIVGRRVVPWILHWVVHTGSRELFRLAVLAIALGFAFGAALLFGVSFALGAFFAGMILAESELSQRAAEETLPLRDAFAVLFFVSVGMLFDYRVLIENPLPVIAVVTIIVVGKSVAAYLIVRAFRHSHKTALTVAASLAQIGEFSFILAGLGVGLNLLPEEGRDLILAGAILSIMLNPMIFALFIPREGARKPQRPERPEATDLVPTALSDHTVLVGLGRVGSRVADGLRAAGRAFVVVEDRSEAVAAGRARGYEVIDGTGIDPRVLEAAGVGRAHSLLVAIPDGFETGEIVEQGRKASRGLEIIARAQSDDERDYLARAGADETVLGEAEIARRMLERAAAATPSRPALVEPPVSVLTPASAAPSLSTRPILDDVEAALLGGLYARGLQAGEAISRRQLHTDPAVELYDDRRLEEAVASLEEKELVVDLGDGRIAMTSAGVVWARPLA